MTRPPRSLGDALRRTLYTLAPVVALATILSAPAAYAADQAGERHVWIPPVEVTQALGITLETKATEALLKKADEQCFDAACHTQLAECRKHLATCVLVPSPASVHEQEIENN